MNDENRLVRVQGPGSVDVSYTYDMAGRMMSRDDGTLTTFTWDEWDLIRETTGLSTTTYCSPQGQLFSFIRDGSRFDVHTDALQSVRMVSDDNGDTVVRFEFDAWGKQLASSFDNLPGGMPYRFLGGAGVRFDDATGLFYARQRWYCAAIQRFISRDFLLTANRYAYAGNQPQNLVDYNGLAARIPFQDTRPDASRTRQSKLRITRTLKKLKLLKILQCLEKAWKTTTIVYGDSTEDGVTGFSDPKPDGKHKLYVEESLSELDTDLTLFHETLHIVAYLHSGCDCLPEEMQVVYDFSEFKMTFTDYSWQPNIETPYPRAENNNRHRIAHSWIYLQEALLWQGMGSGKSPSAASYNAILDKYKSLGGGGTENIEMLRDLAPTVQARFDIPMDFPYRSTP